MGAVNENTRSEMLAAFMCRRAALRQELSQLYWRIKHGGYDLQTRFRASELVATLKGIPDGR